MSEVQEPISKRRRITKACDFCHRRGRRCRPSEIDAHVCQTCNDHDVACTWDRVAAKRGVKPRAQDGTDSAPNWELVESRHGSRQLVEALIEVFFSDVYPIICTIHEESFKSRWDTGQMPNGRASYARLLAVCALSAQRVSSGASSIPTDILNPIAPQSYIDDALLAISGNSQSLQDLDSLQSVHILCVTAMEVGRAPLYHQLMGLYHSVVADQGLADESRWPPDISHIEREERRRMFWHMYRLEVHTALILGHIVRLPEAQLAVSYPKTVSFDTNSDLASEWLTGWNFVTDLYRGLEYLLIQFRSSRRAHSTSQGMMPFPMFLGDDSGKAKLLDALEVRYKQLPPRFKEAAAKSANVARNRCVYQAANIICTYQLLKMFSHASDRVTFQAACDTILELVDGIAAIPVEFLRSMSLAMVQELSGFGHLLSNFIGKDLAAADYGRLKSVMTCMSELLQCLTSSIPAAEEAGRKLDVYVKKIDEQLEIDTLSSRSRLDVDQQTDKTGQNAMSTDQVPLQSEFLDQASWSGFFTDIFDEQ